MKTIRKKRLLNVLILLLVSCLGVFLILYSLNSKLDYFYTPSELKKINVTANQRIKLGGMVQKDSFKIEKNKIKFSVTDFENDIIVAFEGALPDLFKEGSGVVVLGYYKKSVFLADEVLAKHDENYMPPQLKE
tara:strand:+ start:53 stop:451 length:399 start_codon:yes stop_codon:yes gene_type:complete